MSPGAFGHLYGKIDQATTRGDTVAVLKHNLITLGSSSIHRYALRKLQQLGVVTERELRDLLAGNAEA